MTATASRTAAEFLAPPQKIATAGAGRQRCSARRRGGGRGGAAGNRVNVVAARPAPAAKEEAPCLRRASEVVSYPGFPGHPPGLSGHRAWGWPESSASSDSWDRSSREVSSDEDFGPDSSEEMERWLSGIGLSQYRVLLGLGGYSNLRILQLCDSGELVGLCGMPPEHGARFTRELDSLRNAGCQSTRASASGRGGHRMGAMQRSVPALDAAQGGGRRHAAAVGGAQWQWRAPPGIERGAPQSTAGQGSGDCFTKQAMARFAHDREALRTRGFAVKDPWQL